MNNTKLIKDFGRIVLPQPEAAPEGRYASAVLVPVINTGDHLEIILTMRSSALRHHAGQISFPGGRLDEGEGVIDAALRESHEEIGLNPKSVDILGFLPGVLTAANFHIAPVLGVVCHHPELRASPDEVERILIEPLAPLLDQRRHVFENRDYKGQPFKTWVINHPTEYIWGATARMLVQWSQAMFNNQHPNDHASGDNTSGNNNRGAA